MLTEDRIVIHQALHGYADGHRLLHSSIDLAKSSKRELSILTDLSGSTGGEEFDGYITGYPLPDDHCYALSRTWSATEMPRPGCVWTHTLLVGFGDLTDLRTGNLHLMLRRPEAGKDHSAYSIPLEAKRTSVNSRPDLSIGVKQSLARIVAALYKRDAGSVAFIVDQPQMWESAILAIWSQQWPSLAKTFSFCTGAIYPRYFQGTGFDLQLIPRKFYRSSRWKDKAIMVSDHVSYVLDSDDWARLVVDDLYDSTLSDFREFLRIVGTGLEGKRSSFLVLAKIFVRGRSLEASRHGMGALAKLVTDGFPDKREAAALKTALFGDWSSRQGGFFRAASECDVLTIVMSSNALDPNKLDIERRSRVAWSAGQLSWEVLQLAFINLSTFAVARYIFRGIAARLTPQQIMKSRETESMVYRLSQVNPALLEFRESWLGSTDEQRQLIEILRSRQVQDSISLERVVGAIWSARSGLGAREAIAIGGRNAIRMLLDRVNHDFMYDSSQNELSSDWIEVLHSHRSDVLEWVIDGNVLSGNIWRALPQILQPFDSRITEVESGVWLRALGGMLDGSAVTYGNDVAAFVLILGLMRRDLEARELICRAFDQVHTATLRSRLSDSWRERLESTLDELPWWQRWDRAESLRCTVGRRCVDEDWPIEVFLRLADKKSRFVMLIRTLRRIPNGKDYLESIKHQVSGELGKYPKWKTKQLAKERGTEDELIL